MAARKYPSLKERFWAKVDVKGPEDCWLWLGSLRSKGPQKGYGGAKVCGRNWMSHRISWFLTFGEIPSNMLVLHRCDVRLCVNPNHLFLGSTQDNVADRHQKNRDARGESQFSAKLRETDVLEIRRLAACGNDYTNLANKFGVSRVTVNKVVLGSTWQHITGGVSSLPEGIKKSCGRKPEDLTGCRFGRLIVRERAISLPMETKEVRWWCDCDCGGVNRVRSRTLKQGLTLSCGCLVRDRLVERQAKVSTDVVREIRRLSGEGSSRATLSNQFGVSYGIVNGIVNHLTWKHLL